MTTHSQEVPRGERFGFGKNWKSFLQTLMKSASMKPSLLADPPWHRFREPGLVWNFQQSHLLD